jgi:hypothetical protein
MNDLTKTIDTYLAAWNEPDAGRRAALIAQSWAPDGQLTDPPIDGSGRAGITEMMSALHTHYAGHQFRRTSGIDTHHTFARFSWELVAPDGSVAISGLDVAELDASGLLARVTGFFGALPERDTEPVTAASAR